MDKVKEVAKAKLVLENIREFANKHKRATVFAGVAVGATTGFVVSASKVGIVVAVVICVLVSTVAGAVIGMKVAEFMLGPEATEYMPPANLS